MEIAEGMHVQHLHAEADDRLGDLRANADDAHTRAEQTRGLDHLHQPQRDLCIDDRDAGNIKNELPRTRSLDRLERLRLHERQASAI